MNMMISNIYSSYPIQKILKIINKNENEKRGKVVVFDMDETLGYFLELGYFWNALLKFYYNNNQQQHQINNSMHFHKILDLYPEFLRPNIFFVLKYILKQKEDNNNNRIIVYTNNNGPKIWTEYITSYFEYKLNNKIFDNVIGCYRMNENKRTTYHKTINDLLNCADLKYDNIDICFIDDQYHYYMINNKLLYIRVKPYVNNLEYTEMATRYYDVYGDMLLNKNNITKEYFVEEINNYMCENNYKLILKNSIDLKDDEEKSNIMFDYIINFFNI